MATYKKRGYKPQNKTEQQQAEELNSTTAEVFNTLDETANRSEQWIEKNNKALFVGLIVVVLLVLGVLGYNKYIKEPTELEASNELAFPRKYFNKASTVVGVKADSLLTLGLEGADGKFGFLDIAETYSGTKTGNLANYYAGVSYLKMKEYEKAIEYLSKFSSDDLALGSVALGAIGDSFADINQPEEALEYYEKAANNKENDFTTPLFLYKAAQTAMDLKKYKKAEKLYTRIKEKFPKSEQGKEIDKYIYSAKYAE